MKNRSYLIKPELEKEYPSVSYGSGVYLYDCNNKKYLDGSSGAVTASIGHGIPEILEAMNEQAKKVSFVYRSQFTSEPAEALAQKLSNIFPGDLNWSFFVNSGSEATETAMKIAIQYWQERGIYTKNKVISRWMSYHGITMGALSMSGHVKRRERFVPLLNDFPTVSAPYCYRCPFWENHMECSSLFAQELERAILRIGQENIAAFIAEPIIGAAGGAIVPPDNYYREMKAVCEKYHILFIADEVMTGVGRTGAMLAMEHWGVIPDIVSLGKGMSAGYTPMAATIVSDRIMEPILLGSKSIMAGHTYSANPQSAAISLAVIEYIEKYNLVENAKKMGNYLNDKLRELSKEFGFVGDVRGKGLLIGIEFVSNKQTKKPFDREINFTNLVIERAKEEGLLIYPASAGVEGVNGDAVIIAPPLTISKDEVDELVERFKETLSRLTLDLLRIHFVPTKEAVNEGGIQS
ncbi:adenosylmethionine-8-amino-7-oxononanoate aminotransferase [Salirhabdus euzebyi]|uniref:Adenosylmethionine-8-amino-7-oxononanoate aminotransferase n=1 Tax=Salirhabdus euzebyi TaxID=394506 RepID=A0A841Q4L0_9BACI|nr:aspartate aminotransferase family protein [Salirhabdus euzebyi]MBB6453369.1 adenosylmethionine-8-amino-7-oxononanoate aminotransferase [Salirhabdus euzebyi]